ncbi:hypothetical protein KUTeg_015786 [Tegillarca granosa]|uniref:C2H2-type domain-containing protein n=1 Tax=Tegillarca granosa TaxID=220873 RepID=A0ABQ9ET15_TEGGR|nr:hypothetical protein KUTeg_015786 [Tegillarca granosa]
MEIFGEDEASTLMKEMKRICQVFAKKEIETLFLSFDMNDKSSQIFGSSVGMTFLQHLVLIEKFQKFCEDAYVTRNVYATCTNEKEENTDINPDDTDQMDSFEISNTLKIENEDCGKRFSRKKIFDNHCRKHENKPRKWKQKKDIPKEHQCSICGKMFNKSYPLRIHIRYHTGEKPYMCDLCGKVTASKTELNMHKLIHTNERPYSCDICKKSFRMLNKLKRHQIVHTGLKPHKCSECGKCFTTASNMRTHVKNIHMGIKEFACDICNIKFAHSSNMRAHIRGVHKKKEIEEPKNKNEILNLLKSKEYDMNSVTMRI